MKMPYLRKTLQATFRVSIEDSKNCEISKSTLEPYFEIFLTLHPCVSKLSHLTIGTFRYVGSHNALCSAKYGEKVVISVTL